MEKRLKSQRVNAQSKMASPARRKQLVSIAMDHIAAKGFEGLRFQEVAKEAGINNATLFYHFPTKEELIRGVIAHLAEEFQKTPPPPASKPATAIEEVRREFEGVREFLRKQPKLFLVLTEISLRGLRDPIIERVVRRLDEFWRQHLIEVITLGIQEGVFRADIDVSAAATSLMAQMKGIGFHATTARLKRREIEQCIADVATQAEYWLTRAER